VCETPTWCKTQSIPSGVAAGDYECMDFDNGGFPPGAWRPLLLSPGFHDLTTTALSAPNAYRASCSLDEEVQGIATLIWESITTMSPLKSVTAKAQLNIVPPRSAGAWPDSIDIMCIVLRGAPGLSHACLAYTYNSPRDWNANYTGFFVRTYFANQSVSAADCPVGGNYAGGNWFGMELTMAQNGNVTTVINGATTSCPNNTAVSPPASLAPQVSIGTKASEWRNPGHGFSPGMTISFDNVVVAVRR
jgi:hypothetical protein